MSICFKTIFGWFEFGQFLISATPHYFLSLGKFYSRKCEARKEEWTCTQVVSGSVLLYSSAYGSMAGMKLWGTREAREEGCSLQHDSREGAHTSG